MNNQLAVLARIVRGSLYILSILWSGYLIAVSYQQTGDFLTAIATVLVMLAAMIFNDLLRD